MDSDFVSASGVPTGRNDSVDHDAPVVGGQIGLQHQFGLFVVGIEGSATFAYEDGYGNVTCPTVTRTCGKRFDNVLSVGPRLGYAMGKWMPYLTGGYAAAQIAHKSFDTGAQTNVLLFGHRFDGWYIGAGVDMALAQGWTVGLEYRHYDFGSDTVQTFLPTGVASGEFRNIEPTLDTIALRVSWKLGRRTGQASQVELLEARLEFSVGRGNRRGLLPWRRVIYSRAWPARRSAQPLRLP